MLRKFAIGGSAMAPIVAAVTMPFQVLHVAVVAGGEGGAACFLGGAGLVVGTLTGNFAIIIGSALLLTAC